MNQMNNGQLLPFLEANGIFSLSFFKDEKDFYGFGDILLAKRYESGKEKKKIPVGHREGPYLVLQGNGDTSVCLYGTRQRPSYEDFNQYFVLPSHQSGLEETLYFSYQNVRVLKDFSVLSKMGSLSSSAQEKVKTDILEILRQEAIHKAVRDEIDQYPLLPGDVFVEDGKHYLFLKEEDSFVFLLPLEKKGKVPVSFGEQTAFVSYNSVTKREKKKEYHRVGYVADRVVQTLCEHVFPTSTLDVHSSSHSHKKQRPKALQEQKRPNQTEALASAVSDTDFDMESFGTLGAVVFYKPDGREYIVLSKDSDFVVMLDKEKYIAGEYYLQTSSLKDIKKLRYLTRSSFLDVLHSLQDKYSSYLASGYVRSLAKIYETS